MATRWISLVLLLAVVIVIVAYQVGMNGQSTQARYPISRTVKYSLTVENPTNKSITQASFWLYTPVDQGVYQALDDIQSSQPYHAKVDELGNQRLYFTVDRLPPYGRKTYEVTAKIKLSELPNTIPSIHSEDFLSEEAFIEISE
ncbi:MAG: hypothetical protein KZQ89_17830, partial [Candidatus Thiodiazotropha sp. (ex Lucinoma kastoroae)]|nr:hypothetical protein [Candidatus Thiodiazotropha sp. (ex Lucinoma kastoroae)]